MTKNRQYFLAYAIKQFQSQSYTNKELIIVSQDVKLNGFILDTIKKDENIELVQVDKNLNLAQCRNLSVELSTGSVICQWDDDDYYSTSRLSSQYEKIRAGFIASCYTRFLKYFKSQNMIYGVDWSDGNQIQKNNILWMSYLRGLMGTIMFKKSCFHEAKNNLYEEFGERTNKEEDVDAICKISKMGEIAYLNSFWEYIYCYHGKNVYDENHHISCLMNRKVLDRSDLIRRQGELKDIIRLHCLESVDLMSHEIFSAFTDSANFFQTSYLVDF